MREFSFLASVVLGLSLLAGCSQAPPPAQQESIAQAADPLIDGFRKTTVASVCDAVDQITGKRGFMNHDLRPRVPGKVVGRAKTAYLKPAPPDQATPQLSVRHSVEMIDTANPGEVGVIVIEDGLNVAGLGGLMGTAAKARGMAGIILDAGVRDVEELRGLELPVYSRSVVPSSTVGHFASVANGIPVECAGITVSPGDIIVAGEDGVVRVPKDRAEEVLKRAQEIDERETKMVPYIQKEKSLTGAIKVFDRI
ncbi:MAG: RraA family protein [Bryobacterales bacterium]|jgi:regulator of RNase E activity RraA|nr:RraA family protein [Bryobacterales bacterium]